MVFVVFVGQDESCKTFLLSRSHGNLDCMLPLGQEAVKRVFCLLVSSSSLHSYRDGVRDYHVLFHK